jgi:Acetyltransferase (GNAT) domain
MTAALRLEAVGADAREGWHKVVQHHPDLAVCHLPEWMDCVCEAGAFDDATRLYRTADGRLLVLPLTRRHRLPGRWALYDSWPAYWEGARDSGGLIGEGGIVTPDDVRAVVADLGRLPALRIRIVPSTADAPAWVAGAPGSVGTTPLHSYVIDLDGGFERVWSQRFSKKVRYKSRKAQRDGIEIEKDTTGRLLAEFDQLHQASVDAWAREYFLPTPLARQVIDGRHPHRKLEVAARRLGDRCQTWIARRDGEAVSGIIVFSEGAAATYWKGATNKSRSGSSGATDLLHRRAIEDACASGRIRYDLGTSGVATLTAFKLSLGAVPVEHTAYRLESLPLTAFQEGLRAGVKRTGLAVQRFRGRNRGGRTPGQRRPVDVGSG